MPAGRCPTSTPSSCPRQKGFDGRAVELLAVPAQFLAAYAEGAETYELLEQIEADAKPEAVTA